MIKIKTLSHTYNHISFLMPFLVDPCESVTCSVAGEVCDKTTNPGQCKCGTASSCSGLSTGSYCDASNSACRCTANLASCTGLRTGTYCNATGNGGNGECRCTSTVASCSGLDTGSYCDVATSTCKCTATLSCNEPDTCDATNNVCKGTNRYSISVKLFVQSKYYLFRLL